MSLIDKKLTFGELYVVMYDFELIGDTLPEHFHEPNNSHITTCVRGEVDIVTPEWTKTLKEGNIIEFHPYQRHSIVSKTNNSRVLNISTTYVKPQ